MSLVGGDEVLDREISMYNGTLGSSLDWYYL